MRINIIRNIVRNPIRTTLFLLILTVVFSLLNCSVLIKQGTDKAIDIVNDKIKPALLIERKQDLSKDENYPNRAYVEETNDIMRFLEKIKTGKNIKDLQYRITKEMMAVNGSTQYESSNDIDNCNIDYYLLSGVHSTDMHDYNESYIQFPKEITSYFTQDNLDNGDFVCVVEAHLHNVPGDHLVFSDLYVKDGRVVYVKEYSFRVIGKYEWTGKPAGKKDVTTDKEYFDYVYVPEKALLKIHEEQQRIMDEYDCNLFKSDWMNSKKRISSSLLEYVFVESKQIHVSNVMVNADNLSAVEEMKKKADEMFEDDNLIIKTSSQEFEKIAGPVSSMKKLSITLAIMATVLCITLSLLMIHLYSRNSVKDIGVYAALGMAKREIKNKFVLETATIGVIAIIITLITGQWLSKYITDSIIRKNVISTTSSTMFNVTSDYVIRNFRIKYTVTGVVYFLLISLGSIVTGSGIIINRMLKHNVGSILNSND